MELKHKRHRRVFGPFEGIWPDYLQVFPKQLAVGDRMVRSFVVVDYPRHVQRGWFEPLLRFPYPMTMAIYQAPLPPQVVMRSMHRHLLWNRGIDGANQASGHLRDPEMTASIEDAERIRLKIAQGDARVLDTSLHLTLWASSLEELDEATALLISLAQSMLLVIRPLHFQHLNGMKWTLPIGEYAPDVREMETDAWATLFPLVSEEIFHPRGNLWGMNGQNHSLILVDRFSMPSPHSITIAWSGAGKSYAAKLEAIRARYRHLPVYIVDPEGEYSPLEQAGASIWRIGDPKTPQFPFDPCAISYDEPEGHWEREADFIIRFLSRLMPEEASQIKTVMWPLLWQCRPQATRNATWQFNAPPLDLLHLLPQVRAVDEAFARQLQTALERWKLLVGSGPTQAGNPDFQVFDLSRLTPLMKSAAYLALTEWIARQTHQKQRRLVIFDEAWHLLNEKETAGYLEELFRRARKWGTALSLITQDINDFVQSRAAEVCLRNAPIVLLLKQHPESLAQLATQLRLHEGEMMRIATAGRGEGILMVGDDHVPIKINASPAEHALIGGQYRR
ncbi:MAG: ATP-binding protein [Sulfobacillus thermotolerans]|uniref:TraG P-loop domain-containing protein n=1 Tax=Sulfobacillus thermotolerans TaxID=338644 RepID=A0ABM6RRW5_9FIRM|nr:hypothetical protein BXT84_08825 [Sulfobacillus thermotolerans]MCY0907959.1 ATP-binding protein [Sulfobacillus thermotolerans]